MVFGLCKYSGVLGEPGKGVHRFRVGGLAVVDLLLTGALSVGLSRTVLGRKSLVGVLIAFIILMIVAIVVHEAFCVNTQLNAWIFGRSWPAEKNVDC